MNVSLIIRYCLMLLALGFITACEKAPELETQSAGFSFKSDASNNVLTTTDGNLRVDFNGGINHTKLAIGLNQQDIKERGSVTPYRYLVPLDDIRSALNNGENTLVIEDTVTGVSETFTFFLDVVEPRLIVDKVFIANIDLPFPGQNISVEGRISDLTDVVSIDLTCVNPNNTIRQTSASITGSAPNQRFKFQVPCVYPDRADPNYSPADALNPQDTFDSDIHWLTTNADFSVVITESTGEQYALNLVVPESRFQSASEVQINESLFNNLEPYLKAASGYAISQAQFYDLFEVACLEGTDKTGRSQCDSEATAPSVGEENVAFRPEQVFDPTIDNGVGDFLAKTFPSDLFSYLPDENIHGFLPRGSAICPAEVFKNKPGLLCGLYIRKVEIDTPNFDFQFVKGNNVPRLDGLAKFNDLYVDLEIVTITNPVYPASVFNNDGDEILGNGNVIFSDIGFQTPQRLTASHAEFLNSAGEVVRRVARPFTATYEGSLTSRIGFDDSTLRVGMEILAGRASQSNPTLEAEDQAGELFRFNRITPVELEQPFNYGQPMIGRTRCDNNTCTVNQTGVDAIALIYALRLSSDGRQLGDMVMDTLIEGLDQQVGSVVDVALNSLSTVVPKSAVSNVEPDANASQEAWDAFDETQPMRGIEVDLFASDVSTGYFLNQKWLAGIPGLGDLVTYAARFTFDGNARAKFDNTCENPGDASEFLPRPSETIDGKISGGSHENYSSITCADIVATKAFAHSYINDGGIQDTSVFNDRTGSGEIDFSFSLSANFINQYLQANHQTGAYENYQSEIRRRHISQEVVDRLGLGGVIGDEFSSDYDPDEKITVTYATKTAPQIALTPYQKRQKISVCGGIEIVNLELNTCEGDLFGELYLVDIPEVQPEIEIITKAALVTLTKDDGTVIFKAEVDASVYTKPTKLGLEPKDKFAAVLVHSVDTMLGTNIGETRFAKIAAAEYFFSNVLEAYGDDPEYQRLVKAPVYEYDSRELPTIEIKGNSISVTDALVKDGMTLLPIEFGILFRKLSVDEGGDHLLFGLDFVAKDTSDFDDPASDWTSSACTDAVPSNPNYVASLCLR